jgi:uncharacterized protein YbdZ (MbtH family)
MDPDHEDDRTTYLVVVNHEGQYSLWPSHRGLPPGWESTSRSGSLGDCLGSIESVWTDMRPLSLRRPVEGGGRTAAAGRPDVPPESPGPEDVPSLVERLSSGRHPVELVSRPGSTAAALKEGLGRGHVQVRFPRTRGGTLLGLRLDEAASRTHSADLDAGTGTVHLEGELTLDRTRVRCVIDLDPATLRGEGHLAPVRERPGSSGVQSGIAS